MFSGKQLKKLILPLIVEQILAMTVGMADTMMISQAGEDAVSGVALVDMVNYLVITLLSALAAGGAVIVAQYLGSKDKKSANRAAGQVVMASALFSSAIMVLCLVFCRPLLGLLFGSVETPVMEAAVTYFWISSLSFPFLGLYNSAAALFRSMEKTKITMYVSLLMNVINVAGNAVGIFVLHAGVDGVAVPTLVSRAAAAIIMLGLSKNRRNTVWVGKKQVFVWDGDMIRRILKIAVPNSLENGLFALGKVLVTSIVAQFGTAQIAANGVANSIDMIAIVVVNAINLAIVTVVGQCVGANDYDQAASYTRKLMKISYFATGILNVAVAAALPFILNLYSLSGEARHFSLILVLMHNALALALHPTSFVLANGLRAAGDAKYTMYVGIGSMLVFRLGSAWLFGIALQMGIIGVWIAMGTDWLCRSVFFLLRFKSGKWKEHRAI